MITDNKTKPQKTIPNNLQTLPILTNITLNIHPTNYQTPKTIYLNNTNFLILEKSTFGTSLKHLKLVEGILYI